MKKTFLIYLSIIFCNKLYSVTDNNHTELIPLLIKAVQELSAEVKELKDKENNDNTKR
jgi:hypothetical protein